MATSPPNPQSVAASPHPSLCKRHKGLNQFSGAMTTNGENTEVENIRNTLHMMFCLATTAQLNVCHNYKYNTTIL